MLKGKKILITGGTGSLGSAILERAERENWNCDFTVFARNEEKINRTKARFPYIECKVGDVQDLDFLRTVMPGHDIVFHTAAQKVVPLAENNVRTSIITNVLGTLAVCQASVECGVERTVTILTDKLVKSTTVYGATKFLSGSITREANTWGDTVFTSARYGNVVGSANSIQPHLLKLKSEGKTWGITDIRCTRFWLRMSEATDLILLALEQEKGTTVVPKAPASKVIDLFRAVDPDWPVEDIGIRPGEKVHEQLVDEVESRCTVDTGNYFLVYPPQTKVKSNLPEGYGYYSSNPVRWLSVEELKQMMESSH